MRRFSCFYFVASRSVFPLFSLSGFSLSAVSNDVNKVMRHETVARFRTFSEFEANRELNGEESRSARVRVFHKSRNAGRKASESLGALTDSESGNEYLTPEDRPRKSDRVENEWPSAVTKRLVSHSRKCPPARNVGRCTVRRWLTLHRGNSEYTGILRLFLSLLSLSLRFSIGRGTFDRTSSLLLSSQLSISGPARPPLPLLS